MAKYKILLRGENFPINLDSKLSLLGFYTTRTVSAQNEIEAENSAVLLIKSDSSLLASIDNSIPSSPMIYMENIILVKWWNRLGGAGYTFFPMDEAE